MIKLTSLNTRRLAVISLLVVMGVFFVVQLAAQESTGDRVSVGQPVLGQLTVENPSQQYVFTLRSAEIVDINVAGLSPLFTPTVRIYDQAGQLVHAFENLYSRSDYSTMLDFTQPGTYTVEVASLYPVDTQYTFNLQPVGNHYMASESLNRGELVKGAIDTSSGLSRYAFDALPAAYQQLTISGETSADGMVISLVNRSTNQVVAILDETMPGVSYCIPAGQDQYSVEIVNNGTLVAKDYMLSLNHVSANSSICSLSGLSQRMGGTSFGSLFNVMSGSLDSLNPMRVFRVDGTPGTETVVEVIVDDLGDDDDNGGLLVIVEDLLNGDVLSILDLSAILNGLVILPEGDGQYLLKVLLDAQTNPRDVTLNVLGAEGDLLNLLANLNEDGLYTHGSVFSTSLVNLNAYTSEGLHIDGDLLANDIVDAAVSYNNNGALHMDGNLFNSDIVDATLDLSNGIAVTGSVIDYGVVSSSISSEGFQANVLGDQGVNVDLSSSSASVGLGSTEIVVISSDGINVPIVGDLPIVGELPIIGGGNGLNLPIIGGNGNNNSGGLLGGLFP